jgi:hypothetical protein
MRELRFREAVDVGDEAVQFRPKLGALGRGGDADGGARNLGRNRAFSEKPGFC